MKSKIKTYLKIFLVINLLLIFTSNWIVLANSLIYSKKIRAKIMEDFKEEQYNNIFFWDNILLNKDKDLNFFDTQSKLGIYKDIRTKNTTKIQEIQTQRDVLLSRITNLEETISSLDDEIKNMEKEIVSLNREITKTNTNIKILKEESSLLQKEIIANREVLLDYIAHIYKKSNLVFIDSDVDSIKTILLNNGNLWDILSNLHFSHLLEITWQLLIEKHRKMVKEMFIKTLALEKNTENAKNLRKQELIKRKWQIEKKDFRHKILEYTKWKDEVFQQFIKEKQSIDRSLKIKIIQNKVKLNEQKKEILSKYNCDYIDENTLNKLWDTTIFFPENETDEIQNSQDYNCINLNKILKSEVRLLEQSKNSKNPFSWPISPINWLSAYYKDKSYEEIFWSIHEAIDIKASQWTDIKAPDDWYITYLKKPNDESYAYVALKHANWFVSVYWHVSEVLFEKFDFVQAWTVFAKSWWEFGTLWAWYMTTWPHLHFEIFKDKEYRDPLEYLDLTELWDDKIPQEQKYFYKFLDDYIDKYWIKYNWELQENIKLFTLSWSTEVERQQDLLTKYATSDFKNWDIWVEESVFNWIDPSFVMCIWLVETWLWRNLKTPFNVWNVGNTDSWWTQDFKNARSWIYWIIKTLNNKFLWNYNDMNKLSRYWNKNWSIYASSPMNWHKNMTRCLSALKNKYIPDNYNFRVLY